MSRLKKETETERKAARLEFKRAGRFPKPKKLDARANSLQHIYELAEQARRAVWESDDPNDAVEPLDDLIDRALELGAKEIERDYNDENPPQSWVNS